MNEQQIAEFQDELGKEGCTCSNPLALLDLLMHISILSIESVDFADVWQFITLAGFHGNGLQVDLFARAYVEKKMLAYVQMVRHDENYHPSDSESFLLHGH